MNEVQIVVEANGEVKFIYSDDLADLINMGDVEVRRASHVEPIASGGWSSDMSPVGGPILGPFNLRAEALSAEVQWLQENIL